MKQVRRRSLSKLMTKIRRTSKKTQIALVLIVVVFGVVGCILLLVSHATTPTSSKEAETGTVNNPAAKVTDGTASSGSAVKFGGSNRSGGLTLAWNDEFNGSSVDTSKWNVRQQANGYDEVYNLPANVTETGGNLILTAKRQASNGKPYTSGYVDTIGKKGFRFGKFEMRAQLPQANGGSRGIWPAWWLRSDNAGGEIDIMEAWGDPGPQTGVSSEDPYGRVLGTVYANTNSPADGKSSGWSGSIGSLNLGGWHTYSVLWTATGITWYVDDVPFRSVTIAQYPWISSGFPTTANLRLNLQVSSNYYGKADATTTLPVSMVVDYVRIYQ
jgi:beta-glucanase (GH16 family)